MSSLTSIVLATALAVIPKTDGMVTSGVCVGYRDECPRANSLKVQIFFPLRSDELTESAKSELRHFVAMVSNMDLSATTILVSGYTDTIGSVGDNIDLSSRRARAASAFLVAEGIDQHRILALGMGEVVDDGTDESGGNPTNRRVDITLEK